jgi:hypothetical protein
MNPAQGTKLWMLAVSIVVGATGAFVGWLGYEFSPLPHHWWAWPRCVRGIAVAVVLLRGR